MNARENIAALLAESVAAAEERERTTFAAQLAKSDGTVVSWGRNSTFGGIVTGQTAVPAGLGNVVAVSEGVNHAVALKSDGTVVAWGYDTVFSDVNSNNSKDRKSTRLNSSHT